MDCEEQKAYLIELVSAIETIMPDHIVGYSSNPNGHGGREILFNTVVHKVEDLRRCERLIKTIREKMPELR